MEGIESTQGGLTIRSTGSSGACRRLGLHFILPQTSSYPTAPVNSDVRRHQDTRPEATPLESTLPFLGAAAVALLAVGVLVRSRLAKRATRRSHPKDYAFRVAFAWGPEMKLPKIERLQKHLPWVSQQELASWVPELEQAERSLGRLVEEGGPKVLGEAVVLQRIKEQSPFLVAEGLRQALFLVSYGAMHDGYDKQPLHRSPGDA